MGNMTFCSLPCMNHRNTSFLAKRAYTVQLKHKRTNQVEQRLVKITIVFFPSLTTKLYSKIYRNVISP